MRHTIPLLGAALLLGIAARPLSAATFHVPADGTLLVVVAAAEANDEDENIIEITEPVVVITEDVTISAAIGPGTLTIRPGGGLSRAVIARTLGSSNLQALILSDTDTPITIQDLDIVLNWSHFRDNLVELHFCRNVTIERCRIGSVWPSSLPAPKPCSNLFIAYPTEVVVRNCIFFSYFKGNYDNGIRAEGFMTEEQSLYLYNNDVADYRAAGISVDGGAPGSLVLLRNNVVMNHPDWTAGDEPTCYVTTVAAMDVESSHNVAFFDGAGNEEGGGGISILGIGNSDLQLGRADVDPSFETYTWTRLPDPNWWDPNTDFFRLAGGELHNEDEDWGQNVDDGSPHTRDKAVHDDIEKDVRPGQPHSHTDRGADQAPPALHAVAFPSLSQWGVVLLSLVLLMAGTGWLVRRRRVEA